jgi:hypothetical protein
LTYFYIPLFKFSSKNAAFQFAFQSLLVSFPSCPDLIKSRNPSGAFSQSMRGAARSLFLKNQEPEGVFSIHKKCARKEK